MTCVYILHFIALHQLTRTSIRIHTDGGAFIADESGGAELSIILNESARDGLQLWTNALKRMLIVLKELQAWAATHRPTI